MNKFKQISAIALAAALLQPTQITQAQDTQPEKKFQRQLHDEDSEAQLPFTGIVDDTGKMFTEWHHLTKDWFGVRTFLSEHGVNIEGTYKGDNKYNFNDSNNNKSSHHKSYLALNSTFDFEKIAGIQGLVVFTSFETWDDQNGSEGSILNKIWIEQEVLDGQFKLKLGKLELGDDFLYNKNSSGFLSSNFSESPTVLGSIFSTSAFGITAQTLPTENTYITLGIFDGAAHRGYPLERRGPKTLFDSPGDTFFIGEAGYAWKNENGKDRSIGGGIWYHSGPHANKNAGSPNQTGVHGVYALFDFDICDESPDNPKSKQGLKGFSQYAYTDPAFSTVDHHATIGVNYLGLIPSRDDDRAGAGISYSHLTQHPGAALVDDYSLLYELFYNYKFTKFITIHTNYQYNVNPGGTGVDDQDVLNIRFVVKF